MMVRISSALALIASALLPSCAARPPASSSSTKPSAAVPIARADELIVLVRDGADGDVAEHAVREVTERFEVPLSGEWQRVDGQSFAPAGLLRDGRTLRIRPASPAPDAIWTELPLKLSALPEIAAVYSLLFMEIGPGDVHEGVTEFVNGAVASSREVTWLEDATLQSLEDEAARDAWVWERFPVSELARRMGLSQRPIRVRWSANGLGRPRPDEPEAQTGSARSIYLPARMAQEIEAAAHERRVSPSKLLSDRIRALGAGPLAVIARGPRDPATDKVKVTLFLSDEMLAALDAAAVEADTSVSHVVQRVWLHR
jgi:hypothetical protein